MSRMLSMGSKRLGICGRADMGGLAAQTFAVAQHLKPNVALVLDMEGRGRGPFDPGMWLDVLGRERVRVAKFPFTDADLAWLLERSDVVFTAEGPPPGRDDFVHLCAQYDIPLFIHTNPELWKESYLGETTVNVLPTSWHHDRFPDAQLLPMPVDRQRFPFRLRTQARTFLHVAAPAFHDRNGSELLRAALDHVRNPIRLYIQGQSETREEGRRGEVELIFLPPVQDHAQVYPPDADVLLFPRRYGGQALPLNEAASLGMPAIMLDLPPQNERGGILFVKPFPEPPHQHMIGGQEKVWDADPREVAHAIDMLAEMPGMVEGLSARAGEWAAAHCWERLAPLWRHTLGLE